MDRNNLENELCSHPKKQSLCLNGLTAYNQPIKTSVSTLLTTNRQRRKPSPREYLCIVFIFQVRGP
jgi:hypothetical protein